MVEFVWCLSRLWSLSSGWWGHRSGTWQSHLGSLCRDWLPFCASDEALFQSPSHDSPPVQNTRCPPHSWKVWKVFPFFQPSILKADQTLGTVVDGNEWGHAVDTHLTWPVGWSALCSETYLLKITQRTGDGRRKLFSRQIFVVFFFFFCSCI